ncbi:MAG TPA: glycine zipper family protein, partial [Rhodopila sp.]
TLLGAGLGAAIGGGRGAAIGAGAGALGGTAIGAGPSQNAQYSLQQRYDLAYAQCMYSRGNQVPGYQPPPGPPPPPPPGYYPPPGYH